MLPIVKLPTPSLRQRSREITREELLDAEIQHFIDQMIPTMYGDDGIGLAAPQVARNIRIFTVGKEAVKPKDFDLQTGTLHAHEDLVIVNPTWNKISKKSNWDLEGCLSVPYTFGQVKRWKDIVVEAWDRHGNPLSFTAHNFFARVIQHETDHIDGVLFIDKAKGVYITE